MEKFAGKKMLIESFPNVDCSNVHFNSRSKVRCSSQLAIASASARPCSDEKLDSG